MASTSFFSAAEPPKSDIRNFRRITGFLQRQPPQIMKRQLHQSDESWENDAIWKLLDQAPPATASPRFADDTVRAARLAGQPASWWKRIVSPAPLAGLAAATAAVVIIVLNLPSTAPDVYQTASTDPAGFAEIQEIAETETLISAVDQLDDFSDVELVSLIGF